MEQNDWKKKYARSKKSLRLLPEDLEGLLEGDNAQPGGGAAV
jgi:hypothetical protein